MNHSPRNLQHAGLSDIGHLRQLYQRHIKMSLFQSTTLAPSSTTAPVEKMKLPSAALR